LYKKGNRFFKLKKYQDAIILYDKTIEAFKQIKEPDSRISIAFYCKGKALQALGKDEAAKESFKMARKRTVKSKLDED